MILGKKGPVKAKINHSAGVL